MDPQDKDAIELEVRRVLATQEIELRKLWSTEATGFREFLQRQFRYITLGVSTLALVGAGLFVWFFSDSVKSAQEQLIVTVDEKIMDYRILESFQKKLDHLAVIAAGNDQTRKQITKVVEREATDIVNKLANEEIEKQVDRALREVEGLDVDSLLSRAAIARNAVVAFVGRAGCPDGWTRFEAANGRFILGVSDSFSPLATGGEQRVILTEAELPSHNHTIGPYEWGYSINGNGDGARIDVDDGPPWRGHRGRLLADVAGGGQSHNNMPPYIALYFCKKT